MLEPRTTHEVGAFCTRYVRLVRFEYFESLLKLVFRIISDLIYRYFEQWFLTNFSSCAALTDPVNRRTPI